MEVDFFNAIKRLTMIFINFFFNKTEKVEKLLSIIHLKNEFNNFKNSKTFKSMDDLHKDAFSKLKNSKIYLLEFGTFEGASMRKFIAYNTKKNQNLLDLIVLKDFQSIGLIDFLRVLLR